jgi:hypothetical protein
MVAHEDARRMAVDVSEEGFFASVLHLYRSTCLESEKTAMHLQADVFPTTKGAADAAQGEPNVARGQVEARGNLFLILVQPLSGNEKFDTTTVVIG